MGDEPAKKAVTVHAFLSDLERSDVQLNLHVDFATLRMGGALLLFMRREDRGLVEEIQMQLTILLESELMR